MNAKLLLVSILVASVVLSGCVTNNYGSEAQASIPPSNANACGSGCCESGCAMMAGSAQGDGMRGMQMHNMAPVTSEFEFIRVMIPHHQEAVDTAKLTLASTTNEELKPLLRDIITAQEKEIATMNTWLSTWYPDRSTKSSYAPMMGNLEALHGAERDAAFLTRMQEHHQMAIYMATDVLTLKPRAEVKTFALDVVEAQTAEIGVMRELLKQYPAAASGTHKMSDGSTMHDGMMH